MMNIILRELKANLKSLFFWSLCISAIITVWMMEFKVFNNSEDIVYMLKSVPEAMLKAFSMEAASLTSLDGFLSLIMHYIYIFLGVHAVMLGNSILSKEERDKTAEFLYVFPLKRSKVIFLKIISGIIIMLIVLSITFIVSLLNSIQYSPDRAYYKAFTIMIASSFIIQSIFFSVGMILSSIIKRYKKSASASVSVLLGTYFLSIIIGFSEKLEFLKYATPFKYFETLYIINNLKIEGIYVLLSALIIVICVIGIFIFYPKRDLYI